MIGQSAPPRDSEEGLKALAAPTVAATARRQLGDSSDQVASDLHRVPQARQHCPGSIAAATERGVGGRRVSHHSGGHAMFGLRRLDRWMAQRFPATRTMARLGMIASVLSGLATAFHVGGSGGYALPLSYLLGAPTNVLALRLVNLVHPIPKGAIWSGADWNVYLLLFSACVALNWTLLGVAADLFGRRPPSRPASRLPAESPPALGSAEVDPLVREFEELERQRGEPSRPDDSSGRRAA